MTDPRTIPHQRTKGPPSTPAQRLVELNRELLRVSEQLAERNAEVARLTNRLARYETVGGVSFGGITAAQVWADFVLWESILNENKFRAVFELGTWQGGFSWWLWAQTMARQMVFLTYDSVSPARYVPGFRSADVFAEAEQLGATMRGLEPIVLLCDNGNKPRELQTFAPLLDNPESLIVVHDWGSEIHPEDVPVDTVQMVYEEFCKDLGSISRVFKRKET